MGNEKEPCEQCLPEDKESKKLYHWYGEPTVITKRSILVGVAIAIISIIVGYLTGGNYFPR